MLAMAKKKKPNRTGVPLSVYLPPEIRNAFEALAKEQRRTLSAELLLAIENHLREAGKLPRPSS